MVRPRTDFFRAVACTVLAVPVAAGLVAGLLLVTGLEVGQLARPAVVALYWTSYVALYVAWGVRAYGLQTRDGLARLARREVGEARSWYQRIAGLSGTANTLVATAAVAVLLVIYIAQRPDLRQEPALVVLGLLTVAASWVLMVFTFAQRYLRLDLLSTGRQPFVFDLDGVPRFDDYLTVALMASTMGVGLPARPGTRQAWRLLRANTVVAFVFNSVVVAMMVSLLFGGVTSRP